MLICHCKGKTCADIKRAAACGARSLGDLSKQNDAGSACGGCRPALEAILRQHNCAPTAIPETTGRS